MKHKVCLLGAACVGKTSLMRRYVRSLFSEDYQTTVGVTIEKKRMQRGGRDVELVIWDLSGEDEFQTVQVSYLQGASGYLLVVDGTRATTLVTARALQERVERAIGAVPFVLLLNKSDLADRWEIGFSTGDPLVRTAQRVIRTSAKSGAGVELAFSALVDSFLEDERDGAR